MVLTGGNITNAGKKNEIHESEGEKKSIRLNAKEEH